MCCRCDLVVFFIHNSLPSTLNKKKKKVEMSTGTRVGRMGVKSRLASHLKLSLASSRGCWALNWSPSKELFQMHPLLPWVKTLRICTAWGGVCQTITTCIHPPLSVRGGHVNRPDSFNIDDEFSYQGLRCVFLQHNLIRWAIFYFLIIKIPRRRMKF